jgi:hypothetical protein
MPQIDISDRTNDRLLSHIQSFDDTAETVIERLLDRMEGDTGKGNASRKSKPAILPASKAELLPEGEYWLPILEILDEAGGRARGKDVIETLGGRLGSRLADSDHDVLEMGEVRWMNRARFARLRMKERGLISSESPRGIWEITPEGVDYLARERPNSPGTSS